MKLCARRNKKKSDPLGLETEMSVRCLMWMLGTKLRFSTRVVCALKLGISPALPLKTLKTYLKVFRLFHY